LEAGVSSDASAALNQSVNVRQLDALESSSSTALEHADAILEMVIGAAVVPHLLSTLMGDVALRTPTHLLGETMSAQSLVASVNVLGGAITAAMLAELAVMCAVPAVVHAHRGPEGSACVPVYAASAAVASGGLLLL
jgi:hypothetical protein